MKEEIKKLSRDLMDEGITVELLNKINMGTNFSPVQIKKGDKPVKPLKCATGYWVSYEPGKILRGKDEKPIVFTERACRIGRARYLVNFGNQEKARKIKELISEWDDTVKKCIEKVGVRIKELESILSSEDSIFLSILGMNGEVEKKASLEKISRDLDNLKVAYPKIQELYASGDLINLLELFRIKNFDNPILTVTYESPDKMDEAENYKVLINTFGAKALKKWDGDMVYKYAQIEVEKKYPV